MKAAYFDDSQWPVLEIKIRSSPPSDAEMDEYFNELQTFYDRREPFVTIYNASQVNYILPTQQRVRMGKWLKDHSKSIKNYIQAYIFVLPSVFGRIILKGVLLVSNLPAPHYVVNEMDDALVLAKEIITEVEA
ncbi:MAG: hypothetical protein SFY32_01295 [Bacteroidota bacterium]|nr:hypothetical protein [Bacteroidota bacterium]